MNFFKRIRNVALFATVAAVSGFGQNTVTFNVDGAGAVIRNEVYGVLMERLGWQWEGRQSGIYSTTQPNTNRMRNDVIEGFKECGIGCVEWPGGCAANTYAWQNFKKPADLIGVDRFIQFCQLTGAEAVVCGKPTGNDAASNLAFCQYIIDSLKYPLKWFKVGNEVWGCGGSMNVNTYVGHYNTNYARLKDYAASKNLGLVAGNDIEGKWAWIETLMSMAGSSIDAVEFHDYNYFPDPPGGINSANPTTADYWQMMYESNVGQIRPHVEKNLLPALNKYDADHRVKLCIDEWGDWLIDLGLGDGWIQQGTLMNAVSAGEVLNVYTSHADRISVACLAQGVNCIHSVININPTTGVLSKTPTFYVFKMLKPHHTNNAKVVPMTASNIQNVTAQTKASGSQSIPVLTTVASVDASGIVSISFTNADLTATRQVTATLTSSKASYTVHSAQVVTGPAHTSFNDYGQAETVNLQTLPTSSYSISGKVLTATLPSKSVTMFRLAPPGDGVQSGSLHEAVVERVSVKGGSRGTVVITSSLSQKTPVTITLYAIDGKTVVNRTNTILGAENSTCVLSNNLTSNGTYLVKVTGSGINLSKQVMLTQ